MGELVNAHLKVVESKSAHNNLEIYFSYNPEQFGISKSVSWSKTKKASGDVPEMDFGGGKGISINLSGLVLDETLPKPAGSKVKGIKETIEDLYKLTRIDENLEPPHPPACKFLWGKYLTTEPLFYVKSVNVNYEFFDRNGKPLRAKVDISLEEVANAPAPQNPTSRSYGRKMHRVVEGETLDWIAFKEYGDSAAWRHIAETNNLDDPLSIYPGQVLRLVPPT